MKKPTEQEIYKIFKPELTPKRMLELGVFGGSYFEGNISEYPKEWFKNAKINQKIDDNKNRFKVNLFDSFISSRTKIITRYRNYSGI